MILARIINSYRRIIRHPAAHARREEAKRAREARARTAALEWHRVQEVAAQLRIDIARTRSGEGRA